MLPNGDFLLTSEGHPNAAEGEHEQPKIRIFGIDGRQKDELPVSTSTAGDRPCTTRAWKR